MWYYVKDDKTKAGPISDPAIVSLYKKGQIKPATLVWSQHQKKWGEFGQTQFFKNINSRRKNYKLERFKFRTHLLRAVLFALIAIFGCKIYLAWELLQMERAISFDIGTASLQQALCLRETKAVMSLFSLMQAGVVAAAFFVAAIWIDSAITAAKSAASRILISAKLSMFGFLIPVANIILIPATLKKIFYRLLLHSRHGGGAISVIYFRTWIYVWIMSWITYIVGEFAMTRNSYAELEESLGLFHMYSYGLQMIMLLGCAMVAQKIFRMIKSRIF